MQFFDSHAHLTCPELAKDADALVKRAQAAQVTRILNICTDAESLRLGKELAERSPQIQLAAATTPHDVAEEGEALFETMAAAGRSGVLAAIGETGLDYFYTHSPKELQQAFLRRYLRLALDCRLPVIIHCREAFEDLCLLLDEEYRIGGEYGPGILHCFTGTLAEAKQLLDRGFFLSLSGIVTYKKSEALREVAAYVPLDRLLIETDAPYLAPQTRRGHSNEPGFLPETCARIAQVKNRPVEEVASATFSNAVTLLIQKN